jgi:hypothetical protein
MLRDTLLQPGLSQTEGVIQSVVSEIPSSSYDRPASG